MWHRSWGRQWQSGRQCEVVSSIYGFSFLAAWCIQKAQTMRLVVVVVAAEAQEPVSDAAGAGSGAGAGAETGAGAGG